MDSEEMKKKKNDQDQFSNSRMPQKFSGCRRNFSGEVSQSPHFLAKFVQSQSWTEKRNSQRTVDQ